MAFFASKLRKPLFSSALRSLSPKISSNLNVSHGTELLNPKYRHIRTPMSSLPSKSLLSFRNYSMESDSAEIQTIWVKPDVPEFLSSYLDPTVFGIFTQSVHMPMVLFGTNMLFGNVPAYIITKIWMSTEEKEMAPKMNEAEFKRKQIQDLILQRGLDVVILSDLAIGVVGVETSPRASLALLFIKSSYLLDSHRKRLKEVRSSGALHDFERYLIEERSASLFRIFEGEGTAVHIQLLCPLDSKPVVKVKGSLLYVTGQRKGVAVPETFRCRIPVLHYDGKASGGLITEEGQLDIWLPIVKDRLVGEKTIWSFYVYVSADLDDC